MMKTEELAGSWRKYGVVVIPGFLDQREVAALRRICDGVLEQALAQDPRLANARNIAYLTERKYFRSDAAELLKLLEFIADERIISLLTRLAGEPPLFS
jgi:hypothetical protein